MAIGVRTAVRRHPQLREGGQEARLTAESNFYGFRAVSNVDYLSSFLFRLAFNEVFTQAVNSEVKSQVFLSKAFHGFFVSGTVERYQNFFQTSANPHPRIPTAHSRTRRPSMTSASCTLPASMPPASIAPLGRSPFVWSFDASMTVWRAASRAFAPATCSARFDFNPEISLPLQFHGWSLRPALTLHETFYTERFVNGLAVSDPTNRQALETSVELRPPVLEKVFDGNFSGGSGSTSSSHAPSTAS